ncbi:hypothetical protein K435DRAFT_860746 [Dendrothele bispora CBS 962.96]|uniref:CHAT domain-containing protein n=1 Tax=Dendrothele bispora (strain CBS 962.96) TaxID=1314807 RepID=A0A4S8LXB8_DENBC|nr:hypothetical protein K435DRAFT_860746 [Dendrothele bispora CBS 962.96]
MVQSTRWQQSGRLPDVNEPISYLNEALDLIHESDPRRLEVISSLAMALQNRHKWKAGGMQSEDLSHAISLHREALSLRCESDAEQWVLLINLGLGLRTQAMDYGTNDTQPSSTLDEAVSLLRESFAAAPPTKHSYCLTMLALTLQTQFSQTRNSDDLDEAISAKEEEDLKRAILLHHQVMKIPSQRHPNRSYIFNVLKPALRSTFAANRQLPILFKTEDTLIDEPPASADITELNELDQIDTVIPDCRRVLDSHLLDHASTLTSLGLALHERFTKQQENKYVEQDTISEAIEVLSEALKLRPSPHQNRHLSLKNLALAHHTLYKYAYNLAGMHDTLDYTVSDLREALTLVSTQSDRLACQDLLAVMLCTRFIHGRQPLDLDEAILLHRKTLAVRDAFHPDRCSSLNNLAIALKTRSEHMRQVCDLDEAIALHREALATCSQSHSDQRYELALALHSCFQQTHRLSDCDKAITFFKEALSLISAADTERSAVLTNFAKTLRTRYMVTYHLQDLDRSIALSRRALELTPEYDYTGIICINNLAVSLCLRAEETGRLDDLNEAISICQESLTGFGRVRDNPERCTVLEILTPWSPHIYIPGRKPSTRNSNIPGASSHTWDIAIPGAGLPPRYRYVWTESPQILGNVLVSRFLRVDEAGDHLKDAQLAQDYYQAIEETDRYPLSQRFPATRMLARISDAGDDGHGLALDAYRESIQLLPLLATIGLDLKSRQQALMLNTDGLAREAAACAIRHGRLDLAVEFLESGRTVFWSQALQLRMPVDQLAAVNIELANKLQDISKQLENGALRDVSRSGSGSGEQAVVFDTEAVNYRLLDVEWAELVEKIRELEGFDDFLKPKSFITLSAAAQHGTIVILNASSFRSECDAILLTSTQDPIHVPLKTLSYQTLEALARHMCTLTNSSLPTARSTRPYVIMGDSDSAFRKILSLLWKRIVQPVLQALGLNKSEKPPRLFWLPTGPFTSLPLHAAGIYGEETSENVGDFVISSYTPTLNALLQEATTSESFKLLAIMQPTVPGELPLKFTKDEVLQIANHIPTQSLTVYGVPEQPSHVQDILSDLTTANMVHFACHGVQNSLNPLESALLLEERLTVSQLMNLKMLNAPFAFLSACQTATGDRQLPDEAMHLAATLLFTGFRGAVGTLWSIYDQDGPIVADHFYRHLTASANSQYGTPSTEHTASALHFAVNRLRTDRKCSFTRWVSFIHIGFLMYPSSKKSRKIQTSITAHHMLGWLGQRAPEYDNNGVILYYSHLHANGMLHFDGTK